MYSSSISEAAWQAAEVETRQRRHERHAIRRVGGGGVDAAAMKAHIHFHEHVERRARRRHRIRPSLRHAHVVDDD
jgi:hypothetical protein